MRRPDPKEDGRQDEKGGERDGRGCRVILVHAGIHMAGYQAVVCFTSCLERLDGMPDKSHLVSRFRGGRLTTEGSDT